jgi:hypothetical protein
MGAIVGMTRHNTSGSFASPLHLCLQGGQLLLHMLRCAVEQGCQELRISRSLPAGQVEERLLGAQTMHKGQDGALACSLPATSAADGHPHARRPPHDHPPALT